jgi:hypothetical protein
MDQPFGSVMFELENIDAKWTYDRYMRRRRG